MKLAFTFFAAVLLVGASLSSCKKDDSGDSQTSQADQLIGTWTSVSLTSDKPYQWTSTVKGTDGYSFRSDCAKGTYITFSKGTSGNGGSYIFFDNCEKANAQGAWTAGNNVVNLDGVDRKIEQIDASTLIYSYTIFDNTNTAVKITSGFKKQ